MMFVRSESGNRERTLSSTEVGKQRRRSEGAADADLGDPVRRARQGCSRPSIRDVRRRTADRAGKAKNSVVLPAPFADQARIWPLCMSKDTSISAMMPPTRR